MRFLADESCDFCVVRALRANGHDVLAVSELSPGVEDSTVIKLAIKENRVLLTEDSDFGQLVFAHRLKNASVIFIRYPVSARMQLADDIVKFIENHGDKIAGCFVVAQPGRTRIIHPPQD
ncbi:DUF5615 family PIN-like protein [bacterium]|nr:DUF5615 family PIN-like protein [bacterium]